jgi:acyl-coenzyme A thioesterase PaaI-like protein
MSGDTRDYRMLTTDALLRAAVSGAGDDLTLTLDPAFAGLPDTAHGGTLLALFDALAGRASAREVVGHYRRRVPLAVPLTLGLTHRADAFECRVLDGAGAVLVEGRVHAAIPADAGLAPPSASGAPLPVSRTCFACGVDNPIGLRARLAFDERTVGGAWTPGPQLAGGDGRLAPVAVTTLLDEAAFWLGALATGESGMTTELRVTLHGGAAADGAIRVSGERAAVRPRADDPRYWDTRVFAADAHGRLIASASITFVTIRGAARRLVSGLLGVNPADVIRRVFPAYTA